MLRTIDPSERTGRRLPRVARAASLSLLAALSACAGPQAYSDFDPEARFDHYRTYAWLGEEPSIPSTAAASEGGIRGIDPLRDRRIRSAVDGVLAAKGYDLVSDRSAADFLVGFTVGARDEQQVYATSPSLSGGYRGRYGGWGATSRIEGQSYEAGTLAIDVIDGKSGQAVWHGRASKRITSEMESQELVDTVAGEILAQFPPES